MPRSGVMFWDWGGVTVNIGAGKQFKVRVVNKHVVFCLCGSSTCIGLHE